MDDLGVRASDLLQANAVVWVEGPSDRIYIKYWLTRWCEANGAKIPRENIDYAFCFYGGAVLSHFGVESNGQIDDVIDMLKLNRNSFVVIDRDDDFSVEGDGSLVRMKQTPCSKYRITEALPGHIWITAGYTIESYLPSTYVDRQLIHEDELGRTKIGKSMSKVELARLYTTQCAKIQYQDIYRAGLISPSAHLVEIHKFILAANR